MKTRTILVAAVIIILGVSQMANAQVTFGIKGGLNLAHFKEKYAEDDEGLAFSSLTSFFIGGTAEYALPNGLFVEPGLFFSLKGSKVTELPGMYDPSTINHTVSVSYIEVPINLKYKISIPSSNSKVFVSAGPYIAYFLTAKDKQGGQSAKVNDGYKKIDAGINIGTGWEIQNISLGFQYGLGITNFGKGEPSDEDNSGNKIYNRVFSISVGYRFGTE